MRRNFTGALRIGHSTTGMADGGGGATDGFGFVDENFGDVAVEAEVNVGPPFGPQNLLAVFGRANPITGTTYVAGVDFANSRFAIGRNDDFAAFISVLAIDSSVTIDPSETYKIQLFLIGSNQIARLIEVSTGTLLSTITSTDALYTSGFAGILVQTEYDIDDNPVGPIAGSFDNIRAVPEPALVSLLGWGIAGLTALARRKSGGCRH